MKSQTVVAQGPYNKALESADLIRPTVVWAGGLNFFVQSTTDLNTTYHVELTGSIDSVVSMLDATCTCKAGESRVCCVHRAAAWLAVHKSVKPSLRLEIDFEAADSLLEPVAALPEPQAEVEPVRCTTPTCMEVDSPADLCAYCRAEYAEYELLTAYENFANLHPKAA